MTTHTEMIAAALVAGDANHVRLYQTSARFRRIVDEMARTLALSVYATANQAERADADDNRRQAALEAFGYPDPWNPENGR